MDFKNLTKVAVSVGKRHITNKSIPLSTSFYITYKCASSCNYCNVWRTSENEMKTIQIYHMMDELEKAGTQRFGFTGGEPLLREDIGKLISYSKDKNFITTLCTNGRLVPEKINELRDLDILLISLDGSRKIHDAYRGYGSYEKTLKAIKIAREHDIAVWTSTTLTKESINEMDFILEKANELDFKICFQPVYKYSLSSKIDSLMPKTDDFKRVIKNLIKLKKSDERIVYSSAFLNYLYENWPNTGEYNNSLLNCLAGKFFCTISPSGNVYPCLSQNYKNPLNGLDVGFKKAFELIEKFSCEGCYCDSFIESSLLFSFDTNAILNALKIF